MLVCSSFLTKPSILVLMSIFFVEGSCGVGLNRVLQVSKPYGFSFGSFSSSTTYRLNFKIDSNFMATLHIFKD